MSRTKRLVHAVLSHWATALVVVLAAAVLPARAGVIMQTASFGTGGQLSVPLAEVGSRDFGRPLTGSRSSGGLLSFNLFDPALGTLNSVTWILLDATYTLDLRHRAQVMAVPGTLTINDFTMQTRTDGDGNVGGSSLRGLANQSFNLGGTALANCHLHDDITLPGTPGCGLDAEGQTYVALDALAADVAAFIGSGSFDEEVNASVAWTDRVDVGGIGVAPVFGPGPADVQGGFDFSGQLRLVYDYTEAPPVTVPEPGTLWLTAALLPLLRAGCRRR